MRGCFCSFERAKQMDGKFFIKAEVGGQDLTF